MDANLLSILVCPNCKGRLEYQAQQRRLLCVAEHIAFPITADGIPILLMDEAIPHTPEDTPAAPTKKSAAKPAG